MFLLEYILTPHKDKQAHAYNMSVHSPMQLLPLSQLPQDPPPDVLRGDALVGHGQLRGHLEIMSAGMAFPVRL